MSSLMMRTTTLTAATVAAVVVAAVAAAVDDGGDMKTRGLLRWHLPIACCCSPRPSMMIAHVG